MCDGWRPRVAIVDYGMGNLFSVGRACEQAGLQAGVSSAKEDIAAADAAILPGVGAFGDAMEALRRLDLIGPLQDFAASGKPLMGVCLGMQLLMTEGYEFGRHRGLGLVEGEVVRLDGLGDGPRRLKIPHVGWNRIYPPGAGVAEEGAPPRVWSGSPLEGLSAGAFMYFVHSYYPRTADPSVVCAVTRYGALEFCSSLRDGNVFACQFHPERSGPEGLRVYQNMARRVRQQERGQTR